MHRDEDLATIATFYRRVQWTALGLGALWIVWLLAPILSPFVFAALLGWLGDPMVDRLQARGLSRNTAVILVFSTMTLLLVIAAVLMIPLLEQQIVTLVESLPRYRDWFVQVALPWVEHRTGLQILSWLDPERLFQLIREHWQSAGGVAATVLGYVSRSGFALMGWLANIVLLPVLTFFFLRDWDVLVERVGIAITQAPTVTAEAATFFSALKLVEAFQVTAVWESELCTCAVLPETAATLPDAPGKRPWPWPLCPA